MFRVSTLSRFIVHSPRGIDFALSTDEAVQNIQKKYGARWFGAQLEFLHLKAPSKEFLPFYFASGRVRGTFRGSVSYNEPGGGDTNARGERVGSSTRYVTTGPHQLDSVFEENQTQLYAGYKYNQRYVHSVLENEANPLNMKKMGLVDTTGATINLFEQSTSTMKAFIQKDVEEQARKTAESIVRSFHPTASSISISFDQLSITIEEVTPCFVPCFVVKASYDNEEYTLYVNGMLGTVGGPYLLNALFLGRATALSTLLIVILLTPNKVAGTLFGLFGAVIAYYAAFYAAKMWPRVRRDYMRRQRYEMQRQHQGQNQSGFRPSLDSARTQAEYERSTYWDTHHYQKRRPFSRAARGSGGGQSAAPELRDVKGYYKILELRGDESVNEIRSAYRKLVLKQHPDVGGSNADMAQVNEAYRVLRDPQRRAEYDRL